MTNNSNHPRGLHPDIGFSLPHYAREATNQPSFNNPNALDFFDVAAAVSASASTISAKSNWGPMDFDDYIYWPETPDFPNFPYPEGDETTFDITISGTFSYGPLNTVTGTVSALTFSYQGLDLATVTGMNADASLFWAAVQTESPVDHLAVAFDGHDLILGSVHNDELFGGKGRDTIKGFGGDDEIHGGGWADVILGGDGKDVLFGGTGHDRIEGGNGWDELYGGRGNDTLKGGNGQDYIWGGAGNDEIRGGSHADTFEYFAWVSNGHDTILDWEVGENIRIRYRYSDGFPDASATQDGADVVLTLGDDSITVLNAQQADVEAAVTFDEWYG